MNQEFLREISDQLQRERRAIVSQVRDADESFHAITESRQSERGEEAQQEREWIALESLEDQQQKQLANIDTALARIEAGSYGICANCGRPVEAERLRAVPTAELCAACADNAAAVAPPSEQTPSAAVATDSETGATDELPRSGGLPPELDQLDDDELAAELTDIVREDGQVDMEELQIHARKGVVYLEGAVPSEPEHQILLAILTDIAGVQEIVDNLEVQRLAWERDDRSKNQAAQDVTPGTVPNQEPYGGTDDVVLSQEEGVPYEPPENPPAPPNRKD
jgi:DnaK suppressor protein